MKTAAIIDLLLSDKKPNKPPSDVVECFSCGRRHVYRGWRADDGWPEGGMFCSARCREWFDAGNPSYRQVEEMNRPGRQKRMGPTGFIIACAQCRKEFDSRGLRCCSPDCEHRYREREENRKVLAEVGVKSPERRRCEVCGANIPRWRNGRQVRSDQRFCTPGCAAKARKAVR